MANKKIEVEELPSVDSGDTRTEVRLELLDEINMLALIGCAGEGENAVMHTAIAFFCSVVQHEIPDSVIEEMLKRARQSAQEIVTAYNEYVVTNKEGPADA